MSGVQPDVSDLREYLGLENNPYPDEQLGSALDAALEMQRDRCVWDLYEAPLYEAALRRAARILAARGAPLGMMDLGEFGSTPLVRWDTQIEELEAEYRRGGFA